MRLPAINKTGNMTAASNLRVSPRDLGRLLPKKSHHARQQVRDERSQASTPASRHSPPSPCSVDAPDVTSRTSRFPSIVDKTPFISDLRRLSKASLRSNVDYDRTMRRRSKSQGDLVTQLADMDVTDDARESKTERGSRRRLATRKTRQRRHAFENEAEGVNAMVSVYHPIMLYYVRMSVLSVYFNVLQNAFLFATEKIDVTYRYYVTGTLEFDRLLQL